MTFFQGRQFSYEHISTQPKITHTRTREFFSVANMEAIIYTKFVNVNKNESGQANVVSTRNP